MSAFRMNPADGSLELTGSSNSALLVKRRHRYPLRLSPQYPERSWVRFRNSDGRLQVFFLIDELRAQLVVDNIPEQIEQGTDWQDLPDRGVLRIASTEDVIDVQFELCRPPNPDVGRLSEFNIGGEMLPTYSQVEPGDVEYLKYYDCFNDAAAVLIREHFRKQNEEIAVINSKARAKLRIKGSFEAIAVAREVSIPNLTAGTRSMKRIREEGGRDGTKLIRRDDGSFVMASQVVITCMPAMEQMRNDPIAKRPGECRSLLEPMAVALDIAHAMHSFHGDIKPDNVCRNVISSPQWLTLIDTETFSSPSIPPASNHTPGVTDREHFKQVKQMGVVPQPHVLKRTDRRGFISVVLATWIGKVPAIRALARFEPLSTVVPELLLSVDGRQAIVAEVLDKYLERLGEDNSEWCQELLDSVEKAIDSHVTPARETVRMSRRNERAVREILDVAARASATSLIADTEVELERQVALIRRQVKVVGLLLTVVALAVVIVLVLLKMTGGA